MRARDGGVGAEVGVAPSRAPDLSVLDGLEGLITPKVGRLLHDLASKVPADQAIVEIGSYKGKSTNYLALGACSGAGAHVWAVDAWDTPGNIGGRFGFDTQAVRDAFIAQLASTGLTDRVTAIRGFSADVAGSWGGPPVGLLWVDGSHLYADVLADVRAWKPHLVPGATLVFDDHTQRNRGVIEAARELVAARVIVPVELFDGRVAVSALA